jgi:hypothetical protein
MSRRVSALRASTLIHSRLAAPRANARQRGAQNHPYFLVHRRFAMARLAQAKKP